MHAQSIFIAALAGFAAAAPLESRQLFGGTGSSSSEFSRGGCRDILFAFARGSTEIGNMGTVVGPPTSDGLKKEFGQDAVATEGIPYAASIGTNVLPGGTDTRSKNLLKDTLNSMAQKCPDSVIVSSGYSQGAAVNHRAIEELDAAVMDQIAGVVTYGDTQKLGMRSARLKRPPLLRTLSSVLLRRWRYKSSFSVWMRYLDTCVAGSLCSYPVA